MCVPSYTLSLPKSPAVSQKLPPFCRMYLAGTANIDFGSSQLRFVFYGIFTFSVALYTRLALLVVFLILDMIPVVTPWFEYDKRSFRQACDKNRVFTSHHHCPKPASSPAHVVFKQCTHSREPAIIRTDIQVK